MEAKKFAYKKNSDKKRTQFEARISLDKRLKDQSGALHSSFDIYTIKALNGKLFVLGDFFSVSINRTGNNLIKMSYQS